MSAIQFFVWFVLYLLQLWSLSLVVMLPVYMSTLLRSTEEWKHAVAQELFPVLLRYQIVLFILVLAIYFGGEYLSLLSGFRDGYMAIDNTKPGIVFLGIVFLTVATSFTLYLHQKTDAKRREQWKTLGAIFALNFLFLLLFVTTSSALFSSAPGNPVQISLFDVISRILHVLFSAIALLGATIGFVAPVLAKRNTEFGEIAARTALKWMVTGASVQLFTGFVLIMAIGMKAFPAPVGHILLTFGILCAIGVVIMGAMSFGKEGSLIKIARATAMTALLTFFLMVGMRIADLAKKYDTAGQPTVQSIRP